MDIFYSPTGEATSLTERNEQLLTVEVGERLKQFRTRLGLSQDKFASALEGTKRAVQDNELGRNAPNSKLLFKALQLGLNVNWLLSGEGPMMISELKKQSGSLDHELLSSAIQAVEEHLEERERTLSADKKAALVALLYDYFRETGTKDEKFVERILRIA